MEKIHAAVPEIKFFANGHAHAHEHAHRERMVKKPDIAQLQVKTIQ